MAFSLQQLNTAKNAIMDHYNISAADASRVIGLFNTGYDSGREVCSPCPDYIADILQGDLSSVAYALDALQINKSAAPEKPLKSPEKTAAIHDDNIPTNDIKATVKPLTSSREASMPVISQDTSAALPDIQADIVPAIEGDIVPASDDLPSGFGDTCCQWVEDFCQKYNIDISRLKSQQWRSACMYIGEHIKQSDVIRDKEKEKHNGGRVYSGAKLEKLLYVWAYMCGIYNQVPLASDFINFSGVHRNYFYDYDGQGLSSTAVRIAQKAKAIEEGGLGSSVAGGGAGTVGGIFLLKTRHGYSETVTIQHSASAASVGVGDLPLLTKKD